MDERVNIRITGTDEGATRALGAVRGQVEQTAAAARTANSQVAADRARMAAIDASADARGREALRFTNTLSDQQLVALRRREAAARNTSAAEAAGSARAAGAARVRYESEAAGAERMETALRRVAATADEDVRAIRLLAGAVDVTSREAVEEFRRIAAAQREHMRATGGTVQQYNALATALNRVEKAAIAAGTMEARVATSAGVGTRGDPNIVLGQGARRTAQSISMLTSTVGGFGGASSTAALAAGNLAQGIAMVTTSARTAAAASGIGALVILLGVLVAAFRNSNKEAEASERVMKQLSAVRFTDALGGLDTAALAKYEAGLIAARDRTGELATATAEMAIKQKGALGAAVLSLVPSSEVARTQQAFKRALADYEAFTEKKFDLLSEERRRVEQVAMARRLEIQEIVRSGNALGENMAAEVGTLSQRIELGASDVAMRQRATDVESVAAERTIRRMFERRDAWGQEIALTEDLQQRMQALLDANATLLQLKTEQNAIDAGRAEQGFRRETDMGSDIVKTRFEARMEQIEAERAADEKATGDSVLATDRAEQKKRQLRKQTALQAAADLGTIATALTASSSRELRIIGTVANTVRRLIIGAEAADAAVKSAIQFAMIPGRLAVGDVVGAALHGASGVQLAAAAALGFREALGGGVSGGGAGGGSGSGGGGSPTFEPSQRTGQGAMTIIVNTVNPNSREVVEQTRYLLNRSEALDRPIVGSRHSSVTVGLAA